MKMLKKWIVLIMCGLLVLNFTGCGSKEKAVLEESPVGVPEDSYEINWYFQGETLKDVASVEAKVNEYLKDKINATLRMHRLEVSQYSKQMSTIIAAREQFDIAFCADWLLNYKTNAINGAWFAIDEYMDDYMPKTKAMLGDDVLDSAKVNGKIYAVPAMKEMAGQRGWVYREDIAKKHNIDMSNVKSFEDLEPILKKVKELEPDMQYPIDWETDRTPIFFEESDPIAGGDRAAVIFYDKYEGKVMNLYETPEYEDAARVARKFYEEGLIKKDILTATDFSSRLKDGKTFVYAEFLKPGKAQEVAKNFSFPLAQVAVTSVVQANGAGAGSMMAISNTSKNPLRVMKFLELFNNDKYLNNLIIYGIEGKHYNKVEDNVVEVAPNSSYTLAGSQWMMGNVFLNYLTTDEPINKFEELKKFNEDARKPAHYGFKFDPTNVQTELDQIGTITSQYKKQIVLGALDYAPVLAEFKSKLKIAGVDKVIEEAQNQYDEFLATKK